jgi:hypothetical protein
MVKWGNSLFFSSGLRIRVFLVLYLYSIEFLDPDPYSAYGSRSGSRCANHTRGKKIFKRFVLVKIMQKSETILHNFAEKRHSKPRNSDPDPNFVENAVPDWHEKKRVRNPSDCFPLSESYFYFVSS